MSGAREAPSIELNALDGAFARVYLDGAHVTSWIPTRSTFDRLFVSREAQYGPSCSIRGGIPVCFPQFGAFGPMKHHGFARLSRWNVVRQEEIAGITTGCATATSSRKRVKCFLIQRDHNSMTTDSRGKRHG